MDLKRYMDNKTLLENKKVYCDLSKKLPIS